eukprot:8530830-Lingulodinium_polyedra.AAC.1
MMWLLVGFLGEGWGKPNTFPAKNPNMAILMQDQSDWDTLAFIFYLPWRTNVADANVYTNTVESQ